MSSSKEISGFIGEKCSTEYFNLFKHSEVCSVVRKDCTGKFSIIPLAELHYCWLNESSILMGFIILVLILVALRFLDYISDTYTSKGIGKISKWLKLSQALAGATLLALSNGSSDIVTVIVISFQSGPMDFGMTIGSLFGASIFCMTVVLFSVVYFSAGKSIDVRFLDF